MTEIRLKNVKADSKQPVPKAVFMFSVKFGLKSFSVQVCLLNRQHCPDIFLFFRKKCSILNLIFDDTAAAIGYLLHPKMNIVKHNNNYD